MVKNNEDLHSGHRDKTKKCPDCLTSLNIDAVRCEWCGSKVGEADSKSGLAKKPIDWWAYIICMASFIALGLYIWLVFIKE